ISNLYTRKLNNWPPTIQARPNNIPQKSAFSLTFFEWILENPTTAHEAANIVAAKNPIHRTAGGGNIVMIRSTTPDKSIKNFDMPNVVVGLPVSFCLSTLNKSFAKLLPMSCKNVDAEDKHAAVIPLMTMTPITVRTRSCAEQLKTLSAGSVCGFTKLTFAL